MSLLRKLFDWLVFSEDDDTGSTGSDTGCDSSVINPATGLPMTCGIGSLDLAGNPYGCDDSWHHAAGSDDWSGSSFSNDSWTSSSLNDDWTSSVFSDDDWSSSSWDD